MKKKQDNIIDFQKSIHISIGYIIFIVIFIYVVFHIFSFITKKNITVYEVTQGTLASNKEYQALAIREEQVVFSDKAGTITYFESNNSKVGVKSLIYSIDSGNNISNKIANSNLDINDISKKDLKHIESSVSSYLQEYSNDNYWRVYSFKTDLTSQLDQVYSNQALLTLDSEIEAAIANGTFNLYYNAIPGLLVYSLDGYENLTLKDLNSSYLDSSKIEYTNLKAQETVTANQPVYKVITSDIWNLVLKIDDETYESLQDSEYVEVEFLDDNAKTWAKFEILEQAGDYYLILTLDDSMERYADSRFLNIRLLIHEKSGLKIPNTAIVEKKFFAIPSDYFYLGGENSSLGLMIKSEKGANTLIFPTIYYKSDDDKYYIDSELVSKGDILYKPDSLEQYVVGSDVQSLKGVYNINKGYAVFKQINILYANEDYSVVATGTDFGIALYDHIVLQGDSVTENQLINN